MEEYKNLQYYYGKKVEGKKIFTGNSIKLEGNISIEGIFGETNSLNKNYVLGSATENTIVLVGQGSNGIPELLEFPAKSIKINDPNKKDEQRDLFVPEAPEPHAESVENAEEV